MTIQEKIKQLITTVQNNLRDLSPSQRAQLYKDFSEFLKHEGDSDNQYLQHYPILQDDFSAESLFKILNIKIDLDDNGTSDNTQQYITGLLNDKKYEKIWNESVAHLLSKLDELINDTKNIAGVWRQSDAKNANAGRSFDSELKSEISPVIPEKNIDKKTYLNVRGNDAIEDALYNKSNLQFTHSQNNDNPINKYIRLLMDKYTRNVEVEDLNRNFWVIGQTISIISAFLLDEDSPIKQLFKYISSETVQLWENILYLWASAAVLCQHQNYETHVEIVYLPNNNSQNYRKFDNFDQELVNLTDTELIKRMSYLKNIYPNNSIIAVPIIRQSNTMYNQYGTETYIGYYSYKRETDEENFIHFANILQITAESYKSNLVHLYNDKSALKYHFAYGQPPIKDKDIFEEYFVRVIPKIFISGGNFNKLELKLYDAVRLCLDNQTEASSLLETIELSQNQIERTPETMTSVAKATKNYSDLKNNFYLKFYEGEIISSGGEIDYIPNAQIEYKTKYIRPISPSQYQQDLLGIDFDSTQIQAEDTSVINKERTKFKKDKSNNNIEFIIYGHPSFLGIFNQDYDLPDINESLQKIVIPDGNTTIETSQYQIWEATGQKSINMSQGDYPRFGGNKRAQDRISQDDTDEFFNFSAEMTGQTVADKKTPKSGVTKMNHLVQSYEQALITFSPSTYFYGYLKKHPCGVLFLDNGDSYYNEDKIVNDLPNQKYPGAMGYIESQHETESGTVGPTVIRKTPRFRESHETIYTQALLKIPRKDDDNLVYKIPYHTIRNSTLQAHTIANFNFEPEVSTNTLSPIQNYVGAGHRVRQYNNLTFYQHNSLNNIYAAKITFINMEFGLNITGAFIDQPLQVLPVKKWIPLNQTQANFKSVTVNVSINNGNLETNYIKNTTDQVAIEVPTVYTGLGFKNIGHSAWKLFDKNITNKEEYNVNTQPFMPICYRGWNMLNAPNPVWTGSDKSDINDPINYSLKSYAALQYQERIRRQLFLECIQDQYNGVVQESKYIPLIAKPTIVSTKTGYLITDRLPDMDDSSNQYTEADATESFKLTQDMKNDITSGEVANWVVDNLSEGKLYSDSGQIEFPGCVLSVFTTYLIFDINNKDQYIAASCELRRINNDRTLNFVKGQNNNNYYLTWNKTFEVQNASQSPIQSLNANSTQLDFENVIKDYFKTNKATSQGDFVNKNNKLMFDFSKYPSNGIRACNLLEPQDYGNGIYDAPTGNIEPQHS